MSVDRASKQDIIDDWYIKIDERYHSKVNPEAMLWLVKTMVAHGYGKDELNTESFKNMVVNSITHDHSLKPKEWKKMVFKDINRAVKQWFPLMDVSPVTEEEMSKLTPVEEIGDPFDKKKYKPEPKPKVEKRAPVEPKPEEMLDRSMFKNIETTPIEDEDTMLADLGLKK